MPKHRRKSLLLFVTGGVLLGGCVASYAPQRVEAAKTQLLGLNQVDVRMCAGFPDRQFETEEGVVIWSYELRQQQGGINLSAPVWVANTNLSISGSGTCSAQFRFDEGHVTRLAYSGDSDGAQGRNSLCAPIIDGCMTYVQENRSRR